MPVTMRDVARKAGVSIKTVSRVVNDQGEISEDTRQRVAAVIKELGYRPSKVARALVTQKTHTIGLVMGDITDNPFFSEVARGVLDTAQAQGYNVFLGNVDGEDQQQELDILHSLADHAVDGIIVYPTYYGQQTLTEFADYYQPLVSINQCSEHPGVSMVMLQTEHGARLVVDYLVSQGHTAIAMLAGWVLPLNRMRRVQGFCQAMKAHGLPIVDEWILRNHPFMEPGYQSTQALLTQYPEITAIFAYNDLLAIGAIQACRVLGRHVPEECAIIGFDDIQWASKTIPPLTTVRVDKFDLGRQATCRLIEMLDHPEATFPPIYVDVELVIRESA